MGPEAKAWVGGFGEFHDKIFPVYIDPLMGKCVHIDSLLPFSGILVAAWLVHFPAINDARRIARNSRKASPIHSHRSTLQKPRCVFHRRGLAPKHSDC
ncbi:hypothetical protein JAAARDRAFT_519428 [Jaapia argillacea MUCL 33604]|uniref:Uncharacterized protein n=1 Tax=Jaapia argillacea MUCL 33604 TaxID=933084 RepID=A0A067QDY2_9AGAM|nr:hypothetical protein JAAARDRAFT_519428 [Jaapia argillacea MUCL 33604]